MSITASEILFYKAANNNDVAASNGGRISATQITTGSLNNLFPNISNAERVAGKTRYRKMFLRNKNTGDLSMYSGEVWIGTRSLADDYFQLKAGTDTDVQTAAEGYTNWAGTGLLAGAAGSGESSIEVDFDAASGVWDGVRVHITDGVNSLDTSVVGDPLWIGNAATFTISGELGYNFSAMTTIVSAMVDLGTVQKSTSGWVETSSAGTYDEATYPVVTYNMGTVTDSWTLTFGDANNFSVVGANTGSVGSGDISTDCQPANGSSYYFKVDKDGWGGSWALGDTVTFNTVHAGKAIWVKEVVPAGVGSYSNNEVSLGWRGESA
jgi:hypothetical protein